MRSPELQVQIDGYYVEWRKSRVKWNTPRRKWYDIIQKLRRLDTYRYAHETPLSEKELVSLRGTLQSSRATRMCRWSVRRDGDVVVIQRVGMW